MIRPTLTDAVVLAVIIAFALIGFFGTLKIVLHVMGLSV